MKPVYLGSPELGNQVMTPTGCRGIGGQCPPYTFFHHLRVVRRPMKNCLLPTAH
jgi:hypothetical protein